MYVHMHKSIGVLDYMPGNYTDVSNGSIVIPNVVANFAGTHDLTYTRGQNLCPSFINCSAWQPGCMHLGSLGFCKYAAIFCMCLYVIL